MSAGPVSRFADVYTLDELFGLFDELLTPKFLASKPPPSPALRDAAAEIVKVLRDAPNAVLEGCRTDPARTGLTTFLAVATLARVPGGVRIHDRHYTADPA